MKVTLLVPCFNEEKSLRASINSCLDQTRKFDEIIFIDDSSSDSTTLILKEFIERGDIISKRTPQNTGKKSNAQEFGLQFVTGDIFVTTDADTMLDPNFCEEIHKSFQDEKVFAVAGYVKSLAYNWLTLCRAFEYTVGQRIHKVAQDNLSYLFVMPGAASAFRTSAFKEHISFDHDTITEDLDFTYKMHHQNFKITYNMKAICYTQDPSDLKSYINQIRRWFGGGWQNLIKHYSLVKTEPIKALELSLIYAEGIVFSILLFILPVVNPILWLNLIFGYLVVTTLFTIWAAISEKRLALVLASVPYLLILYVHSYIYLEQFVREIILKRKTMVWHKPKRVDIELIKLTS
ncbi:MAG: glycosyltransferase family 2 protein [bacterium]|nr:glycosyltransferase family 2 protein [bacterium]